MKPELAIERAQMVYLYANHQPVTPPKYGIIDLLHHLLLLRQQAVRVDEQAVRPQQTPVIDKEGLRLLDEFLEPNCNQSGMEWQQNERQRKY